jgi:uncharacterized protein DUF3592
VTNHRSWMSFARRSIAFWFGVGLIGFGAIFGAVQVGITVQEQRYAREGRLGDGLVVTKAIKHNRRGGSSSSSTEYRVAYRFTVGGQTYEGEDGVSSEEWERLRELEPVQIQYVTSSPATNRIAGNTSTVLSYVFGVVGALAALIGVVLLVKSVGSAKTKARIWAHGADTEATVSSVEETNVKINKRPMWVVRYQYRDHTGQAREGQSDYMSAGKANAWKTGDRVPIRYDRDQPDLSVWLS